MAGGLPITCSTCPAYYAGNGRCGKKSCGGPVFGRDFPDYSGPIPRRSFAERCLVCGEGAIKALLMVNTTRFGLCARHQTFYETLAPFAPKDQVLPPPPRPLILP